MSNPQTPDNQPSPPPAEQADGTVHHRKHPRRRAATVRDLNLTSFLDVTFQLLIFFVLTTSIVVGEGVLPADLPTGRAPAAENDPDPPAQPIQIVLRSLGGDEVSIQLEGLAAPPADFEELYQRLASLQNGPSRPTAPFNADDPVVIRPDADVPWRFVVEAFNAAVRSRYSNVNFAQTNP